MRKNVKKILSNFFSNLFFLSSKAIEIPSASKSAKTAASKAKKTTTRSIKSKTSSLASQITRKSRTKGKSSQLNSFDIPDI